MTRAELVRELEARAMDAERISASAPVAAIVRDIIKEVERVDGWPAAASAETFITLEEAGARLSVTPRWLREQRPPYVVQLGDKTFRVSEQKLARFLAAQAAPRRQLDYTRAL